MNVEIIYMIDMKKNKKFSCNSLLIPTTEGNIYIDDKTKKIITDIVSGELIIKQDNSSTTMVIQGNGVVYFNKKELTIVIK